MKNGIKLLENLIKIKKESVERRKKYFDDDESTRLFIVSEESEISILEQTIKYLKEDEHDIHNKT